MTKDTWGKKLSAFKENERPETVLLVAGQPELMRIAVAWMHTEVTRAKRLTRRRDGSEREAWCWLWENARYDRAALLARVPNATARTERDLNALIANRVLYPDGTLNLYVERYLKARIIKLFAPSAPRRSQGAA